MAQRIVNYPLQITDHQVVTLKVFAKPLSVQFMTGQLCMWAEVSDAMPEHPFDVRIIDTDSPMPNGMEKFQFLGTVQQLGAVVRHVFLQPQGVK
jgi:hypothetical protein